MESGNLPRNQNMSVVGTFQLSVWFGPYAPSGHYSIKCSKTYSHPCLAFGFSAEVICQHLSTQNCVSLTIVASPAALIVIIVTSQEVTSQSMSLHVIQNTMKAQVVQLTVDIPSSHRPLSISRSASSRWSTLEFRLYGLIFVLVVPFMFWIPVSLSSRTSSVRRLCRYLILNTASHPNYALFRGKLSPGWIFGRQIVRVQILSLLDGTTDGHLTGQQRRSISFFSK